MELSGSNTQLDHGVVLDINSFTEYQNQTVSLSDHGRAKTKTKPQTCLRPIKNKNIVQTQMAKQSPFWVHISNCAALPLTALVSPFLLSTSTELRYPVIELFLLSDSTQFKNKSMHP